MSVVTQNTERRAITILAQLLPYFERLDHVGMTAEDDHDATRARNLIMGIIESNPQRQRKTKK